MVSPSKTKHSRVAANQHQKTANASKVKLVKGPTPLVHHRFYLDIQKHQLASKIEGQIKELGGQIEFFLSKDITHFITDKDYSHYRGAGQDPDGGPSNSYNNLPQQQPLTPTTPLTPKTPLSSAHLHHLQYVNEASPSSPSCTAANGLYTAAAAHSQTAAGPGSVGTLAATFGGSESRSTKPAAPRSRADAMLQRVRQAQQQQQQSNHHQNSAIAPYNLLAGSNRATSRPCSPASPAPAPAPSAVRLDRNSQSPAQLAKSWGKPIWTTDQAIKFLGKVSGSCKQGTQQQQKEQQGDGTGDQTPKVQPQILRADYIKIESYQRHHYRPAFQVFKAWPALNWYTKSNHSPFDSARGGGRLSVQPSVVPAAAAANQVAPAIEDRVGSVKTTATTNQTNATTKQEETQQQAQCGYCEICRIEYDVLANHLNADEHRAFVGNDANFEALDKLIADGGVSLGTFLSANQEELDQQTTSEAPTSALTTTNESSNSVFCDKDTARGGEECDQVVPRAAKKRKVEEETIETIVTEQVPDVAGKPEVTRSSLKTYSRKGNASTNQVQPDSSQSATVPAKRTYAGRKSAKNAAPARTTATAPPSLPVEPDPEPAPIDDDAPNAQMFGRRSAIHHHPHNTLNHHNHQKAKAARQAALEQQQQQQKEQEQGEEEEQVVMKLHAADGTERNQTTKRHAAAADNRMGMKQSSIKSPTAAATAAAELMECEGLDPKNTKRISLGLRQNPKRANLNEDFTSLLDETLGPMRKPRIRRESAKRVNYSEPREDEIASQEELIESILLESTAQEAAAAAAAAEENCRGKKKTGSPKRASDVKIRGIRWRAPSPQSRPPVKSPLLYKVIEDPKPKSKKNNTTSPTKDSMATGSPTKATKNGLIVKIRRVRQSELSLLNDEAENFMFPKKDDSSDEDTDEDRQTSSETGPGDYSQEVPSSDVDHRNSSIRKSAGTPLPMKKRPPGRPPASESPSKKAAKESLPPPAAPEQPDQSTPRSRRVGNRGAAALLADNADYYKFPDPGSRLRFPEAPIQPNPEVEDDEIVAALMTPPTLPPPSGLRKRGRKPANHAAVAAASAAAAAAAAAAATVTSAERQQQQQDLLLATRVSPGSPYQHQEQLTSCGKAIISYVSKKGKEDGMGAMFKWSTFVRNCQQIEPYRFAFERVPSLEPWYETFQRQDEASEKMYEYFGNTAYRKLPYEMGGLPPLRQNCCILNYRMKSKTPESTVPSSSNSSTCDGATTNPASSATKPSSSEPLSLPLKKRKLLVDSDRPRKSPREHASTLAILSLLHQQQQHNRRRTISGSSASGVPLVTTANLPPPSPVTVAGYSPKKVAIQQQQQQEADSALGDEIRSSCGSDPITEKDEPMTTAATTSNGAKKIKFDPPIMPEGSFVDYKSMCQQLEDFLGVDDEADEQLELPKSSTTTTLDAPEPLKQNLLQIVQACDKEPPLSLKLVSRHESIVRKIVQYDRKPRPLSAISIKSFDGGGGGGPGGTTTPAGGLFSVGIFKKRINRTGWPNVKKRIVTRKQQQQQQQQKGGNKRDSGEGAGAAVKKEEPPVEDGSRKSSTEESQVSTAASSSSTVVEGEAVKQEVVAEDQEEEDDDDDDEDEFEDTMTMLDPEEEPVARVATNGRGKASGRSEPLLTDDEEEGEEEEREEPPSTAKKVVAKKETEESRQTPEPTKTEEILIPSRPCPRSALPSSKYVTKTTTTMTRIDYNVPSSATGTSSNVPGATAAASDGVGAGKSSDNNVAEECDSISSRSIFVSDDCDTTSSTLINMCPEADPLALPCTPPVDVAPPDEPADADSRSSTPVVAAPRGRPSNNRHHVGPGRKRGNLQPIVCLQKINCSAAASTAASCIRTRSSSRTPVKKTYKRSVFTSALVNSSGKPLKKKRKRKKLKLLNGTGSPPIHGSSSPSCSDDQNSSTAASSSLDAEDPNEDDGRGTDSPTTTARRSTTKTRPPTPSPVKFSPRKLRKPRGRWYRER